MKIIQTIEQLKEVLKEQSDIKKGLVPTMGALNEGHIALIDLAKKQNDFVIVSVFVNPTQFGPHKDFDAYPRDIEADTRVCASLSVDILFVPSVAEMYGNDGGISFQVGYPAKALYGRKRHIEFEGLIQIVFKLFMIIHPKNAYFGQIDAQQLAVTTMFVRDYYLPVKIVGVPIIREIDGLAKNRRNRLLTQQERLEAVQLHQALVLAKARLLDGEEPQIVIQQAISKIEETSAKVDYLSYVSYPDLKENVNESERKLLALAVQFSNVRLIDNEIFT